MKKILAVLIMTASFGVSLASNGIAVTSKDTDILTPKHKEIADNKIKEADIKDSKSKEAAAQSKKEVRFLKNGRVRFSSIGYEPKALVGKQMDLMNAIFVQNPIAIVRMFKAAIAVKKLLEEIQQLKPLATDNKTGESIYFATTEEETNFIKKRIKAILDPIERFLEEALEKSRTVALVLFATSLGENARNGFLVPSLDAEGTPAKYLVENIITLEDLKSAISEFFIFFSDLNLGLSQDAMDAYKIKLKELQDAQKKQAEKKN